MGNRTSPRRSMRRSARSTWAYVVALLPATIVIAAQFTGGDRTGVGPPLTLLVPPILVAAWLGGQGPGFLATGLAGVAWVVVSFPRFGAIEVDCTSNMLRLALFLVEGALVSRFVKRLEGRRSPAESRLRALAARDGASSRVAEPFRRIEHARSAAARAGWSDFRKHARRPLARCEGPLTPARPARGARRSAEAPARSSFPASPAARLR